MSDHGRARMREGTQAGARADERACRSTILAAARWPSNAELIRDVHRLGYLGSADHVLDPTYGNGTWWKAWRPEKLTAHVRAKDGSDFRSLPYPDGSFDVVAYDPPYVCVGGRRTSTVQPFHERYGMNEGGFDDPAFTTPAELQQIINDGLTEMHRLVKPRGIVFTKSQDYVSSGRLWLGTYLTLSHALSLGFRLEDRLEHVTRPGPQPSGRRQVHARRNLSTLFILRKTSSR